MDEQKTIEIPVSEYEELIEDSKQLSSLNMAGVDNWSGYGFAREMYNEHYGEEEVS